MKHRLSQILLCLARIKPDFKQRSVLLGAPLLIPWQPDQESVRWFLMMVMALIVLLFIAVAVLLPITLRLTQGRQKKKSPAPAPTPAPEPPLP
ncbi:MAG: hypothetical protein HC875_31325 [Anaerolineales bacterium]|nr:hypothetical protein [Anaerolineales bacterium]